MNDRIKLCVLCMAIICALTLVGCRDTDETHESSIPTIPNTLSQPQIPDLTWEAYESLSAEEKIAFQDSFVNMEAFDTWLQSVQNIRNDMPWDNGGKAPSAYTWDEFEALTAEQQIAFQESFGNLNAFMNWMDEAQMVELELPWDNSGKQPEDYTWEEFESLSPELQIAFQDSFEHLEAFDAWMQRVNPMNDEFSWDQQDKALDEYTWEEFENMSPEEQIAFQNAFGSFEAFDQWLSTVQSDDTEFPWESGNKALSDYTWEEFEAMSAEEQIRFQNSFSTVEEFENWLFANMPE